MTTALRKHLNGIIIGSCVRPSDDHCCTFTALLLNNGRYHENRITGGHDGMRQLKFHLDRSIDRRVIAMPIFLNKSAVRHVELEFCHSGPPTMRFDYPVKRKFSVDPIFAVGDIAIL